MNKLKCQSGQSLSRVTFITRLSNKYFHLNMNKHAFAYNLIPTQATSQLSLQSFQTVKNCYTFFTCNQDRFRMNSVILNINSSTNRSGLDIQKWNLMQAVLVSVFLCVFAVFLAAGLSKRASEPYLASVSPEARAQLSTLAFNETTPGPSRPLSHMELRDKRGLK